MSQDKIDTNVHFRLKQERLRLGVSQSQLAEFVDISLKQVGRWETSIPIPSDKLAKCAELGIDVVFVLTGQRASPLTPEEAALLDNYRNSPPEAQAAIRSTGAAFAQHLQKKVIG